MQINIGNSMVYLVAWIICAILVLRTYFKMSKEERKEAMSDFKSARFIFSGGFVILGWFLATLSQLLTLGVLEIVGIVILTIGGVVASLQNWNVSKAKTFGGLILITLAVTIIVS